MSDKRYTEEFKVEAVKQITERGHSVYDVSRRLGVTTHSLYSWRKSGNVVIHAENRLQQDFDVQHPNQAWVTDITYVRTYEGWLFLAVVIDLFSRQVIG